MDVGELQRLMDADRKAGITPMAVVPTIGTTATTSVDPVREVIDVCREQNVWVHVDAAYAGVAAMLPECRAHFTGWEQADSVVLNPHKWLFVPFDLSAFYCRRMDVVRATFSIVPDFLTTKEGARNLMDTGIQLGRRFRALKLWMVLRHFGADGIRALLREHLRLARVFASWIEGSDMFELLAPVPFSVVCFRARPHDVAEPDLDAFNVALVDKVNSSGEIFLSHTRLNGTVSIRLAIGHARTTEEHVARAWALLQAAASELAATR
jgi:aromatic-L-amino-acid decarboxylase